ncbi:hypothetical protein G7066_09965 [Leucobacter coleopterorum]|uniref:Uncharacterized protein n=1 Tax=Leucobacter coleopterorum TaxID=2714933 RepID=A0ABX6JWZ9_9MICO|nr:hypothetical protein [Leucobacter coleopterorum]QIM18835.1 hypothetical protein G7066_09965 [Leucobacter coleopterorum]
MKTKLSYRFSVPAVLVIAALALTGCSGDPEKKKVEEGPLSKYMSAMWGDEEYNQEYYDKQQVKIEELVADCMAKEAFEYIPNTENGGTVVFSDDEDSDMPDPNSMKFAETYGYGFVTSPYEEEATGGDGNEKEYVDPNQEYLDSLSDSERAAYDETLWGTPTEMTGEGDEDETIQEYDWKSAGCYGAAQHEVQGEAMEAAEDPEFKDLFDKMQNVWTDVYGDGENASPNEDVAKINREWSECIVNAGYDFANPDEAWTAMMEDWNKVQEAGYAEGSDSDKEPTGPSKAEKKKFQEKEIKAAVADRKCQDKVGYIEKQQDIVNAAEQKFVDEHKSELDAMLAKYGSKKKDK